MATKSKATTTAKKATPSRELYPGYAGAALTWLKKFRVKVGSDVVIDGRRGRFEGRIQPRGADDDDRHIILKTPSGYFMGVAVAGITAVEETGWVEAAAVAPAKAAPATKGKPLVKLLGAGGALASRFNYEAGTPLPALTADELYAVVPELADICSLAAEKVLDVAAADMGGPEYVALAQAVAREIKKGADGVVVSTGVATMHYAAAALAFMVGRPPVPVVLAASERPPDHPSADGPSNLLYAARAAATSDIAEVVVCAAGTTSEDFGLLHRGPRVRKMHASSRASFRTIGDTPLATVNREGVTPLRDDYARRRDDRKCKVTATFDESVALVYYYPYMRADIFEALVEHDYRGIVVAGAGLGRVPAACYPALAAARDAGVAVYMTTQALWGYAQLDGDAGGRELRRRGVIAAANMLPEVAYVKLCWALGQTDDLDKVEEIMLTPVAAEITAREPTDGYLILQGGLPNAEARARDGGE